VGFLVQHRSFGFITFVEVCLLIDTFRASNMKNEFTAVIEHDLDWVIAYCPETPGANGQGKTKTEALSSLKEAIQLILEVRRDDALRGVPAEAEFDTVVLE
jgi:predicted RNase H-like HicB family nuclease